jgi:hypothetical protein
MNGLKITEKIKKMLDEPLPSEAIKQHPTKKFLSTIKAIYVVERLNECFGIGGWVINNEVVETRNAWVVVKSTLTVPEYGIIIPDIFGGNDNPDLGDAYKGACTDALTKIGSYLGIGMNVYKGIKEETASEPEKITTMMMGIADELVRTSTLPEEKKVAAEKALINPDLSLAEYTAIVNALKQNQPKKYK